MTGQNLQPIDKIALSLISSLGLVMGGLVVAGQACGTACFLRTGPYVQQFNWQNQAVGAEDRSFILTFDRPMDATSVEKNLVIDPPLPGKISWAGRRLAYTLETPIPYGETYQVQLEGAREKFRGENKLGKEIQPFVGEFRSRDRVLAYIGTQGEEQGRLILYNLTRQQRTFLTPSDLVVIDFKAYPQGEGILFSASERNLGNEGLRQLQLYRVKTGIEQATTRTSSPQNQLPKLELVLDNQDYQNNEFDLSGDGKTIVVQRVNRQNPADFDLWMIQAGENPKPLNVQGGEFLITPDSQTLAVARGEGISILPLEAGAKPLDFLPKFGQLLSFSRDGTAAAMVDFNTNDAKMRYQRSLFYVDNRGVQKKLLDLTGSIIDCQFNPDRTYLYCLLTQLLPGEEYQEQPYFARIDLKTAKVVPLATLPEYRDIKISLAPDGLGILFDQVITSDDPTGINSLTNNSGEAIIGGHLWLLIPPSETTANSQPEIQELPLVGFRPQWLP